MHNPVDGQVISGRYRILESLGSGGMGTVFKVMDLVDGDVKALKLMSKGLARSADRERLVREFLRLSMLRHPGIVRVYEQGWADEKTPFYTMEFIDGRNFADAWAVIGPSRTYSVIADVLEALAYIHSRGMVHLDIKPSNILVTGEADSTKAKLTDFGLAKVFAEIDTDRVSGTPGFLAPELLEGKPADGRCDLYSLGVAICQASGGMNIAGEDRGIAFRQGPYPKLAAGLERIISRLLERDPVNRYQFADEILKDLAPYLGQVRPLSAKPSLFASAFSGRQELVRDFVSCFSGGRSRGKRVFLLSGGPGIGKSRLLRELFSMSALEACVPFFVDLPGQNRELELFQQICERAYEKTGDEFFLTSSSDFLNRASYSKEESFFGLDEFLIRTSEILSGRTGGRTCLAVLVDSAHLMDELSSAYLSMFPERSSMRAGVFALAVAEPLPSGSFLNETGLSGKPGVTRSVLGPLSGDETRRMVSSMLGTTAPPANLAGRVTDITGGNPLYIEQLLRNLLDKGFLSRVEGTWKFGDEEDLPLPGSLEAAFENVIRSLTPGARSVLEAACIFGTAIRSDFLEKLSSPGDAKFPDTLNELLLNGLIAEKDSGSFVFVNSSLRQYLIRSAEAAGNGPLHTRLAQILEMEPPGNETVWEIAEHYLRGESSDRTKEYAIRAAHAASARNCPLKGAYYLRTLLETHPGICGGETTDLTVELADLLEQAGMLDDALRALRTLDIGRDSASIPLLRGAFKEGIILRKKGELGEARAKFEDCLTMADKSRDAVLRGQILVELGWLEHLDGKNSNAMAAFDKALTVFEGLGDAENIALALIRKGILEIYFGRLDEALASFSRALSIAEKRDDQTARVKCLTNIGFVLGKKGELERSIETYRVGLSLAIKNEDNFGTGLLLNNIGSIQEKLGRLGEAGESYARAIEVRKKVGNRPGEAWSMISLGWVLVLTGEWQRAKEQLDAGLEMSVRLADKSNISAAKENLAELAMRKGDMDGAEELFLESRELKDELGLKERSLATGSNQAFLALEKNDFAKAMAIAGEILSDDGGFVETSLRAKLLSLRAVVLCADGKIGEAKADIDRALEIIRTTANPVDAAKSKQLLGRAFHIMQDNEKAETLLDESAVDFRKMGMPYETAETLLVKGRMCCRKPDGQDDMRDGLGMLNEAAAIFRGLGARSKLEESLALVVSALEVSVARVEREARREADVRSLQEMLELANSIERTEDLLAKVMDLALRKTGGERGLIALFSKETGDLQVAVNSGVEKRLVKDALHISRSVLKDVAEKGVPLVSKNAVEDKRFMERKSVVDHKIRSLMCIPLMIRNEKVGAIYVDRIKDPLPFPEEELSFLEAFGHLAGVIVEVSRLKSEVEGARNLLSRENESLRKEVASRYRYENLIGQSEAMMKVFYFIEKAANSTGVVLITGESGTGKELIAKTIHYTSPRAGMTFRPVNCAAIPKDLVESELFGIEERVATGVSMRKGLFEEAEGGTVFLDEIGDMELSAQAKLLRVLQDKEVRRVGGRRDIKVDVRVIVATNRDLRQQIRDGKFREDLYFRISILPVEVPPLRERILDIPLLVDYFVRAYYKSLGMKPKPVPEKFVQALTKANWPGNVRQLFNCVERALVMSGDLEISKEYLPEDIRDEFGDSVAAIALSPGSLGGAVSKLEIEILKRALEETSWNKTKAAQLLGISEPTMRYKMIKYRLSANRKK